MSAKIFAWSVHLFTATGLVMAALIAVLVVRGGDASFRLAFALMFAATLVDAVDGYFARKARVKEVLPGFDGRRLDDLIDFLTYTCLPVLLMWRARLVSQGGEPLLLIPLLASAYGFSQVNAKTGDGYFLGFPSYWNIVAFYLYLLNIPAGFNLAIILVLAVLTFVPSCYLYTTQPGRLNRFTNYAAVVWTVLIAAALASEPGMAATLTRISLVFPVYYMAASWWITWKRRTQKKYRTSG